jgi:CheY-like chemotaxis protein
MSSSQPVARDAAGLRVLLVEDEIMIALLVEEILVEFGHTVVGPASRINRALELVASEAIDVAILDVNINDKDVYPVAEALAARHSLHVCQRLRHPARTFPRSPKIDEAVPPAGSAGTAGRARRRAARHHSARRRLRPSPRPTPSGAMPTRLPATRP